SLSLPACRSIRPLFFLNVTAPTEIYTLSLHDALPISDAGLLRCHRSGRQNFYALDLRGITVLRGYVESFWDDVLGAFQAAAIERSEEHTSELQSPCNLVCRLLLEKKKKQQTLSHEISK